MHYAVLLGISTVGYGTQTDAINLASLVSEAHPTRLVRIINTHDDTITFLYRNGTATFEPEVKA